MGADRHTEEFLLELTSSQNRLFGYLVSVLGSRDQAEEVLQQTNLVLCRKSDEFEAGSNFIAWAFRVARYEAMAHRERLGRDRLVFGDDAFAAVADAAAQIDQESDQRVGALERCLRKLPPAHAALIRRRYLEGESVGQTAAATRRSVAAVTSLTHRIRRALLACIQRDLTVGEAS